MKNFNFCSIVLLLTFLLSGGCTPRSQVVINTQKENTTPVKNTKTTSAPVKHFPAPSHEPTRRNNDLTALFQQCEPAVFLMITEDNAGKYFGTGFFISSNGIAISNYHVYNSKRRGAIQVRHNIYLRIEKILFQSKELDYVIFKAATEGRHMNFLPVARQGPAVGEEVFTIGNPQGLENTLSSGIVSAYRENGNLIQTTTEITHGSSGGPLINMRGEVVGITTSGIGEANLNFCVNIQRLPLSSLGI